MTRPPGPPEPTVDQVISPHPDPLAEISQWFETYGDVYYSVALNTKMYGLRHPDHIHELLVAKVNSFRKREDLTNVLGQGLLTSHGDLWRKQRRLIQPAFDRRRIDGYATEVEREANKLVAQFEHGQTREIERDMRRVTVGIVAGALFSTDVTDYVDEIDRCMMVFQTSREPFAQHRAVKSINRVLFEIIDRRLSRADSQDDLLGWLLTASDGEMSLQQLRDELATFLLAGHETTSIALTWALHLLSENPDVQDSFHDAVDNGDIAYVERVALEALRLYPPSYALPRVALEDTELAGYPVEAGLQVVALVYHCHRDPRWFVDPLRFDPDRFIKGRVVEPRAFLPFGAGGRACIGKHLAMLELTTVLSAIGRRFRLRTVDGQDLTPDPSITLRPKNGLSMTIESRAD